MRPSSSVTPAGTSTSLTSRINGKKTQTTTTSSEGLDAFRFFFKTPHDVQPQTSQQLHSAQQLTLILLLLCVILNTVFISMGNINFISAAVLDISRKTTAVKERADCISRLYSCTQNLRRLSSWKLYCKCMLAAGRPCSSVGNLVTF